MIIGRGHDCGVRFDSPEVSREHLDVYCQEGTWWLRDRGSRNGTTVDGRQVRGAGPVRLSAGSRIVLGSDAAGEQLDGRRNERAVIARQPVEVAGFGNENTRGQGAGYQDRWAAGSGHHGSWLAVADGIGGGPAGQEAAQVAVGLAQVMLSAGELTETELDRLFDATYVALRPWWVQERGGGTTLTVATVGQSGLVIAGVGDSPAYVDFGAGFELVSQPKESHVLKEWLGSTERPHPWTVLWRPEQEVRGVIITSDGVDPSAVAALAADWSAAGLVSRSPPSHPSRATTPPRLSRY